MGICELNMTYILYVLGFGPELVNMVVQYKQSSIHLKSEKQLEMCDSQIFSAFMHRNEPPTVVHVVGTYFKHVLSITSTYQIYVIFMSDLSKPLHCLQLIYK